MNPSKPPVEAPMPTIGHATLSAARLRARCAHESAQVPSSVGSEDSAMFLTQFHEMSELLPYISNNDWRRACALVGAHRPLRMLGRRNSSAVRTVGSQAIRAVTRGPAEPMFIHKARVTCVSTSYRSLRGLPCVCNSHEQKRQRPNSCTVC